MPTSHEPLTAPRQAEQARAAASWTCPAAPAPCQGTAAACAAPCVQSPSTPPPRTTGTPDPPRHPKNTAARGTLPVGPALRTKLRSCRPGTTCSRCNPHCARTYRSPPPPRRWSWIAPLPAPWTEPLSSPLMGGWMSAPQRARRSPGPRDLQRAPRTPEVVPAPPRAPARTSTAARRWTCQSSRWSRKRSSTAPGFAGPPSAGTAATGSHLQLPAPRTKRRT
mmetsp:Transcript_9728/g.28209  ORF Transcript_9728/g.28209 Transcript_9728/m.28209 type:complete len:222 (-) Transcript_9728:336-1001(-)